MAGGGKRRPRFDKKAVWKGPVMNLNTHFDRGRN